MGFFKNAFMSFLLAVNVVFGVCYLIGRNIGKAANFVGKIGVKVPSGVPFLGGVCIPGSGLKALVNVVGTPFLFIGKNIKLVLVIDAVLIIVAIILYILKRFRQKWALDGASDGDPSKRQKLSKLMDAFK